MTRAIAILAAATALLGLGAGIVLVMRGSAGADPFAPCRRGVVAGEAAIGGPFALTDTAGERRTDADVITGPTLVYFGFSFCPDVCPMDLARNAIAADLLAEEGVEVEQVFISVDPERDTPAALAEFTDAIHPDLVGLTGTEAEVAEAAEAYRVYSRKAEGDGDFYTVDHSTYTYLMAPGHGFLDFFPSEQSPEQIADTVQCYVERL